MTTHLESLKLDKSFPLEVWEQVCDYLYPSQLCRLSRTSRTMHDYVGSLKIWQKLFVKVHGPLNRFQLFEGMLESRSYMLFMCASSLGFCEECGLLGGSNLSFFRSPWKLPLSVPVPVVEPCGELHLCLSCRQRMTLCNLHDPVSMEIRGAFLSKQELLHKYSGQVGLDTIESLKSQRGGGRKSGKPVEYSEQEVWNILRERCGGDVGINATTNTLRRATERLGRLMHQYSHQSAS